MADKTTDAKKTPAVKKTAAKKAPAEKKTAAAKAPAEKKAAAKAPAEKKAAAKKAPAEKKAAVKKTAPVIKTVLQIEGKDYDLEALIALSADALKKYKSVHKRKTVEEFAVYIKPEDNTAYYTINGEGQDDFQFPVSL